MRRFLIVVALYALPLLLLLAGMEVLLRRIPNDYSYKAAYLEDHASRIKILVLGGSHAYRDVDPDLLSPDGFSAANVSQTYRYDLAVYARFADRLKSLEWIVLPISYPALVGDLADGREAWRIKNYAIYFGFLDLAQTPSDLLELLNRPFQEQIEMIQDHLIEGKDNRVCLENGAGLDKKLRHPDLERQASDAIARHADTSPEAIAGNRQALHDLIKLADEHGVRVYLFTPPASKAYRDRLDRPQFDRLLSACLLPADRFDNVAYRDLLDDERFSDADYSDADHLNYIGAAELSRQIAADLARDLTPVSDNGRSDEAAAHRAP